MEAMLLRIIRMAGKLHVHCSAYRSYVSQRVTRRGDTG